MRWTIAIVLILGYAGLALALPQPERVSGEHPQLFGETLRPVPSAEPNSALLAYDSGPVYYFPDATVVNSLWGVRFSPAQACSVHTIQVYAFQGSGQVSFHFYTADGEQPGVEFYPPQIRNVTGDLTLETITISPVDVGNSDFFIFMEILSGPPPFPVTDADGGTGRSWFRFPGQDWEHVIDFDITLRAGVSYYGPDLAAPEVVHIPVTLGFSAAPATEIRCGIDDPSGVREAWVLYRVQGSPTFDSVAMTHQIDNEWSALVPAHPAGDQIEYFIRAYDSAVTGNLATYPVGAPATLLTYSVHPGQELAYDDGYPEMFFFVDTTWTGNAFAVRMTPPVYPARVNLLRAYVTDTTSFDFEIRTRVGDSVGGLLAGPFTASAPAPYTWADLKIPDAVQPIITAGDFMLVLRWKSATPASPAVGADSLVAATQRSYSFDGTFGWFKYVMFDWLLRAAVATPTGIVEIGGGALPRDYTLRQNYPNPFNPETRIVFALATPARVRLAVFNLLGQQVRVLVDENLSPGEYVADFDARDTRGRSLPSGVYFYRLETDAFTQTRKMILMR